MPKVLHYDLTKLPEAIAIRNRMAALEYQSRNIREYYATRGMTPRETSKLVENERQLVLLAKQLLEVETQTPKGSEANE